MPEWLQTVRTLAESYDQCVSQHVIAFCHKMAVCSMTGPCVTTGAFLPTVALELLDLGCRLVTKLHPRLQAVVVVARGPPIKRPQRPYSTQSPGGVVKLDGMLASLRGIWRQIKPQAVNVVRTVDTRALRTVAVAAVLPEAMPGQALCPFKCGPRQTG